MRRFGLRGRLAGALVLTSIATLAVTALGVLAPLDRNLRHEELRDLASTVAEARGGFRDVPVRSGLPAHAGLERAARTLATRAGARVGVFGEGLQRIFSTAPNVPATPAGVRLALETGRTQRSSGGGVARVAVPVTIHGEHFVVTAARRLTEVTLATTVVRRALLAAAAAGLGIALVLGIGLATTLLRRLRRLRLAVAEVERRGLGAPPPADAGGDEIGELARAFAAMQARLGRQEEARRTFVSTASHELRTPLTSLQGILELAGDDLSPPAADTSAARARIDAASEQTRVLGRLAADLLDLSRIDSELELRSEAVELGEVCRAVAAEFEARARETGVRVELDEGPGRLRALGDPSGVARIVRLLLDNGLRFAPAGTAIRVATTAGDAGASVAVTDAGPGVPDDERDRIFGRFERGRETGAAPGFGLGLAIGRELARRMGGELELAPSTGTGARFVLRLPAADSAPPPVSAPAAGRRGRPRGFPALRRQ